MSQREYTRNYILPFDVDTVHSQITALTVTLGYFIRPDTLHYEPGKVSSGQMWKYRDVKKVGLDDVVNWVISSCSNDRHKQTASKVFLRGDYYQGQERFFSDTFIDKLASQLKEKKLND